MEQERREEVPKRGYDLPSQEPEYAEIAKEPATTIVTETRGGSAPPLLIHQRSPSSGSTSSLSPQSILRSQGDFFLSSKRKRSLDSSPRSRKKVSICDIAHDSNLPQELAIKKALNVINTANELMVMFRERMLKIFLFR